MRWMKVLVAVALLALATASANAATYTVKKGDCLSKIAVRYHVKCQALHQANKGQVRNPDLIYPGQKLQIPEKVSGKAKAASKPFLWEKPGANPFGNREFTKAIKMFDLPEEVKTSLIAKVKSGIFEWHSIGSGDHFKQMVFGNYHIVSDVYAQWNPDRLLAAKKYSVKYENRVYYLVDPLICRNWSWWSEEVIKPPAEKPPEIVAAAPPPPEPEEDEEELLVPLILPPVVVAAEFPPNTEEVRKIPETCLNCQPDVDITVGAFADRHQSGNNPHGIWGVGNFYACDIKDGDKIHSVGFALEGNYWYGVTGDEYYYYGRRYAIDAAYRLLTPDTEFQVRAGLGKVDDWGHIATNPSGEYESSQTSKITTAYVGFEKKRDGTPWFNRVRYFAQADLDISRDKSDQWADASGKQWPLHGEPSNKTMFNIGVDGSVYKLNKNVSLAAGASVTHYQEGSMTGLRVSPGVDFYGSEMLIGGARVNPTYWSHSDHAIGIGAFIDLTNLVKVLWPDLLPKRSFVGTEWKEKKVDQKKQEQTIQQIL